MDSFDSETLSGDTSSSSSSTLPVTKKEVVRKRKIRATQEFIPPEPIDLTEDDFRKIEKPKQNLSFLPKIDDILENAPKTPRVEIKTIKFKNPALSSSVKKPVTLKLTKFKIKKKTPKIKIKLPFLRRDTPIKSSLASSNIKKSKVLLQALSDVVEESYSDSSMSLKLKKDKGGWKSVSKNDYKQSSNVVLKDVYVSVTPLEKTNLLTKNQLQQLNRKKRHSNSVPLVPVSYKKPNLSFSKVKRSVDKENIYKVKISVPPKSQYKQKSALYNQCRPCMVILERLDLDKIKNSLGKETSFGDKIKMNEQEINQHINIDNLATNFLSQRKSVYLDNKVDSREIGGRRSTTPLVIRKPLYLMKTNFTNSSENLEDSGVKFGTFSPAGSSSPFRHSLTISNSVKSFDKSVENSGNLSISASINESENIKCMSQEDTNKDLRDSLGNLSGICKIDESLPRDTSSADNQNKKGSPHEFKKQSTLATGDKLLFKVGDEKSFNNDINVTQELNDIDAVTPNSSHNTSVEMNGTYEIEESGKLDDINESNHLVEDTNGIKKSVAPLNRTLRRSYSLDNNPEILHTGGEQKKRRSTLTLDESVNDVALLKSTCDSGGTPQKLSVIQKRRHSHVATDVHKTQKSDLFKKTLKKKFKSQSFHEGNSKVNSSSNHHNFSKVTIRKHHTSYLDRISSNIENISSVSNNNTEFKDGSTFDIKDSQWNQTDDFKLSTSFDYTTNQDKSNLMKSGKEDCDLSSSITGSDSEDENPITSESTKEVRRVTFGNLADMKEEDNRASFKTSISTTPKSALKSTNGISPGNSNRRVTFSEMSVIIIDDSDASHGSPVPTNFPPDDDSDDSVQELTRRNYVSTAGRTPARLKKNTDLPKFSTKRISPRTRISSESRSELSGKRVSNVNKMRLSIRNTPLIPKDDIKPTSTPKRKKIPDFAKIHQRMYDKMLDIKEYSKKKDKRAQLLLSGNKPDGDDVLSKKTGDKQGNSMGNDVRTKKQLLYPEEVFMKSQKQNISKKVQLVASTPKVKENKTTCYGFKITSGNAYTKKDQVLAIANKVRPLKSTKVQARTEIKGVRSNRRFELLMKMRKSKQE